MKHVVFLGLAVLWLAAPLPGQGEVLLEPERVVSGPVAARSGPPPAGTFRVSNVNVSDEPLPQNEVSIAINPDDPLNLVVAAHDYRSFFKEISAWTSFDGGRTWKGGLIEDTNPDLAGYNFQGDPALAAYRHGVFYYGYIDHNVNDSNNRLCVARSDDGGLTWPVLGVIADHPDLGAQPFEDKPYIAVDDTGGPCDGSVYISWVRLSPSGTRPRIFFARSTDGGRSWSEPLRVTETPPAFTRVTGPVPVVGPAGEVHVAWRFGARIELATSSDGGASFGPIRQVAVAPALPDTLPGAAFRVSPFPSLAVDRSGGPDHGTLLVAWADRDGVGLGPDVLLARSTDGGDTWDAPVRVSDDTNGSYQFFPWVTVGPDGTVWVVYHDQRTSPGTPLYHTSVSRSVDGGRTFGPSLIVSEEPSDASLDGFEGTFIGDYIGIAASPLGVYPAWTDIRASRGNAEVFVRPMRTGPVLPVVGGEKREARR